MERLKLFAIWVVVFYFVVDHMADNPQEVRYVRDQMRSIASAGAEAIKRMAK